MSNSKSFEARWQSNIKQLITEQIECSDDRSAALVMPWKITMGKLLQVADEAIRINDPMLNLLMCELALYTVGDGYHEDYNAKIVEQTRVKALEFKEELKKDK